MSFEVDRPTEHTAVIHISEMLDFRNADEFKSLWQELVEEDVQKFLLHFNNTRFVDSTGIGAIFSLYRRIDPTGGKIAVAEISDQVEVVLDRTQADDLFPQYETLEEARASFLEARSGSNL